MARSHPASSALAKLIMLCTSILATLVEAQAQKYTLPTSSPLSTPLPNGPLFLWEPSTLTLRAGQHTSGTTLGAASTAFGFGVAEGNGSFAVGSGYAVGAGAVSVGGTAWGANSFSSGFGYAEGDGSTVLGQGYAAGPYSLAVGSDSYAAGHSSIALGIFPYAVANGSLAVNMGQAYGYLSAAFGEAMAFGQGSAAFGVWSAAGGAYSMAAGEGTNAGAYASLAIGRYNLGSFTVTPDNNATNDGNNVWIATDPVFEIGIGGSAVTRANAMTVFKDGRVVVHKRQGDILMGEFGN